MASEQDGGGARRKGSAGRGGRGQAEPVVGKDTGRDRGVSVVDGDPWDIFYDRFWEAAEGGSAGGQPADKQPGGERKAGTSRRTTAGKSGR